MEILDKQVRNNREAMFNNEPIMFEYMQNKLLANVEHIREFVNNNNTKDNM